MNEKRSAFFSVFIIAAVILSFTAADLVQEDRLYSEAENRVLASRPKLTVESLFSGDFTKEYETYVTDQFVGRDKWILVKTYTDLALQKKEVGGVYLGAQGYLIEQHLPEDYSAQQVEEKLQLLEKFVEKWDARVMLVPTADNILEEMMPAHAPRVDEKALLSQVENRIGAHSCIDVYSVLMEHADQEIYYHTDHHWTSLGAYYGYLAWAEAQGLQPAFSLEDMETVAEGFRGTLYAKAKLSPRTDTIHYFPRTMEHIRKVTYDLKKTSDTCYEWSHLDTRNKYAFFLDDNHALVEIDTGSQGGGTLFVVKDSYANCLVPLLAAHYEKIYVMDLRYFNGRLFTFMGSCLPEEGKMDVLLLYNCIHFLEEFKYVQ